MMYDPMVDQLAAPDVPAPSTTSLVDALIRVTDRLSLVVAEETEALKEPRFADIQRLGPEKSKLATNYDTMARALRKRPAEEIKADPAMAQRLAQAVRRLDGAARANAEALRIQMTANRRILDLIAKTAANAAKPSFSYGGTRLGHGIRAQYAAPPVAINRVF
jgi:flagellar biosynthesis/type III secretory pathway chaperone